ncbi:amidohydrolase family protein [Streptomyces sp. NPDC048845]|uniref:amidohydrolase family protein n=1 Tax=Streptomyces sp. NPDC048845 TaxID=3155390 RepID=UPI0034185D17
MAPPIPLPPLVDQHCHGVVRSALDDRAFEALLTESDRPAAPGTTFFDSQLGFAVRRWCPPLLGLDAHVPPGEYLERRRELGPEEVLRRLLPAAGIGVHLVDTGLPGDLTPPAELAAAGGGTAREIVRLETLAERLAGAAAPGTAAGEYVDGLDAAVLAAARTAAGFKSVVGYRHGLDFDPRPPSPGEVRAAADRWLGARRGGGTVRPRSGVRDGDGRAGGLRGGASPAGGGHGPRLTDPVLLRHLLWQAVRTGLPLQLHTGFGDPDLRLHRCDPLLLTDFLSAVGPAGCPVVLLHGYPYHRGAGYLAHVFPHVYADIGLALSYTGARARTVLAEALELCPFGKLLFSTDAYGLPELYVVGSRLFAGALTELLGGWVADGSWPAGDAERVAAMIAAGNARRVYGLGPGT